MKPQFLKHSILLVTSVACITFSFAQKNGRLRHSSSAHSNSNNYLNINNDSSVNPVQTRINYKNGQEMYNIEMSADKVTGLYVNDKKIPADSFYLYNSIIDKIKEQIKKDKAQAEEDRKQAALDMQQAEKDKTQATTERTHAQEQRKQAEKNREQAVEERKLAELDRKQAEEDRALIKNLIEELIKDDIIPDGKSVTQLMLTNEEFIINGKKQSEELHSKFKAKFLKKPGHSISYRSVSGYGIYLNK